jgi:CRISPR/Cas system-associated protein endoribonuclease Cas2
MSGVRSVSVDGHSLSELTASGEALLGANSVEGYASQEYPNIYSNVAVADDPTRIIVGLTERDAAIEADLRRAVSDVRVDFELRQTTQADQLSAHHRVVEELDALKRRRIVIGEFGPDPGTGGERVTVLGGTEDQLAEVRQIFGPAVVPETVPEATRAIPDSASRDADSPSWNAGGFISNGSGDCTSGIPTHNRAGQQFLMTAAHCFALGDSVFNRSVTIPLGTRTVAARDLRDRAYDAELISAPSSDLTFTGATSTTAKAAFTGSGSPVVGARVCSSGAFEGERCLTVISVNSCLPNSITGLGRTLCAENYYYSATTQSIGQGDSGGPVYAYDSRGVTALGLHNLHDPNYEVTCTNWFPQTNRTCSGHGWFVSTGPAMSGWGLAVN